MRRHRHPGTHGRRGSSGSWRCPRRARQMWWYVPVPSRQTTYTAYERVENTAEDRRPRRAHSCILKQKQDARTAYMSASTHLSSISFLAVLQEKRTSPVNPNTGSMVSLSHALVTASATRAARVVIREGARERPMQKASPNLKRGQFVHALPPAAGQAG